MANVTIEDKNGNTFTFNDGDVDRISESITSEIDHSPMPMGGSMQAYAYDFNGVTKRITVSGVLTAATSSRVNNGFNIKTIKEQKQYLESLMCGNQTAMTFSSEYADESTDTESSTNLPYITTFENTTVFIEKMDFNHEAETPLALPFEISMIVAR